MTLKPRYWCVVPAAGVGRRMRTSIPKQYLPLNGSTVIQQTLARLSKIEQFESIVLCISKEDTWWSGLENTGLEKVVVAQGGAERSDSVLNGLKSLTGKAQSGDWVLVHDVARPCVQVTDIQKLIDTASSHSVGGLLGTPVRDTMKRANASGEVDETVSRDRLWHALTPQMFRYGELIEAITVAFENGINITDESSAIEIQGKKPLLVEGQSDNIKITHPDDLDLATLFLQRQDGVKP